MREFQDIYSECIAHVKAFELDTFIMVDELFSEKFGESIYTALEVGISRKQKARNILYCRLGEIIEEGLTGITEEQLNDLFDEDSTDLEFKDFLGARQKFSENKNKLAEFLNEHFKTQELFNVQVKLV